MAGDKRECFTIVEDVTSAEGVRLPARQTGVASGDNHMPALVAQDKDGKYILIKQVPAGESPANAQPVIPALDSDDKLQYLEIREEGQSAASFDALPALVAKDPSGNLAYLKTNDLGELLVETESAGTELTATAIVTAVVGTPTTICELTLTATEVYEDIQVRCSNTFATKWELVQVDDAALTVQDSFITGPGQFSFSMLYKHMVLTAGATGTQKLRIRATQLIGAASDCHAYIECLERA